MLNRPILRERGKIVLVLRVVIEPPETGYLELEALVNIGVVEVTEPCERLQTRHVESSILGQSIVADVDADDLAEDQLASRLADPALYVEDVSDDALEVTGRVGHQ